MAIVIAGVIGGALVGVIGGTISDHSDHSASYSDYSDYEEKEKRERKKREEENRQQRRMRARQELDGVIQRNVNLFENREGVKVPVRAKEANCSFNSFDEDMGPMTRSAEKAIKEQIATDLRAKVEEDKQKLKEIDRLIQVINEKVLQNKKPN